jgi:hypothetical protein
VVHNQTKDAPVPTCLETLAGVDMYADTTLEGAPPTGFGRKRLDMHLGERAVQTCWKWNRGFECNMRHSDEVKTTIILRHQHVSRHYTSFVAVEGKI